MPAKTDPLRAPRQSRSALSTTAILDAAAALIASQGIAATTIAAVAGGAGSSVGAIYFRFGDKERLVAAVLQRVIDEIVREITALLDDAARRELDASELLARYIDLSVTVFRRNKGLMRALFAQSFTAPDAFEPWRRLGIESRTRLVDALADRAELSALSDWKFRVLAGLQVVYGALLSATMQRAWPMELGDARMPSELSRMLLAHVGLPAAGGGNAPAARKPGHLETKSTHRTRRTQVG